MKKNTIHPTPQFARGDWTDLCGRWDFAFDDHNIGMDEGWECRPQVFDREIIVPFPPESVASGLRETAPHPVVWYRRTFPTQKPAGKQRLVLHFGAVDYSATVWLNGSLVAQHRGGHTPFAIDITRSLHPGDAEQVLVVRAEDQPLDLAQPRGKQDWLEKPHVIWYYRTTGIWQPVWLEWLSTVSIDTIRWTPDVDHGRLRLDLALNRAPAAPLSLRVRLSLKGDLLAEDTYRLSERQIEREISLPLNEIVMQKERILWSPEHPNLIEAQVTLLEGSMVVDEVSSYAGMRSIALDSGRFLLNGSPYYLRLVLEQGYWPESCLAAPSEEAIRCEVEWIKALGFNGARLHQKVEDPRFLYWCDRLGLLVWGEMANAYVYSPEAAERLIQEWIEVLKRDYNHPSIVTWVPVNESWGTHSPERDSRQRDFLKTMYSLTKALDPTRPVIDNDGWDHILTDILSLHDYSKSGSMLVERYGTREALRKTLSLGRPIGHRYVLDGCPIPEDMVVMLTEFGGISYKPEEGTPWFGYGTVSNQEEYLGKLQELVNAVLSCQTIAGYCYTQLTDTEQETNGLLTADRKPKFDLKAIRQIITTPKPW
jgi:beta-galactosidase/beta-glucuronidase